MLMRWKLHEAHIYLVRDRSTIWSNVLNTIDLNQQDLRPFMSEGSVSKLQELYDSVEDIDLYTGLTQEPPEADDGLVGRTFRDVQRGGN